MRTLTRITAALAAKALGNIDAGACVGDYGCCCNSASTYGFSCTGGCVKMACHTSGCVPVGP